MIDIILYHFQVLALSFQAYNLIYMLICRLSEYISKNLISVLLPVFSYFYEEESSTSYIPVCKMERFQLSYHVISVPKYHDPLFAYLCDFLFLNCLGVQRPPLPHRLIWLFDLQKLVICSHMDIEVCIMLLCVYWCFTSHATIFQLYM